MMNDLYSAVIHDVKNTLTELSLRLSRHDNLDTEVEMIINTARRLSDILLVHRESSDLLQVNVDVTCPATLLESLVAEYRELFPSLSIHLDVTSAPVNAFFDDALARLALGNALHNACRHAVKQVNVSAYEQNQQLVFEIVDDGAGFPDAVISRAGTLPSSASKAGTGLGLYLAYRIAYLHQLKEQHGAIMLDNTSQGARFRMMLP